MKHLKSLLCFLSFHNFKLIEEVGSVEVYCCTRCKKSWAVETERQQVYELSNRNMLRNTQTKIEQKPIQQDVFSIQDEAI